MLPLPDDEGGCDKEMDRIRVLLTLLTTDYNPDSLCMRRVVGVFNNEGGCGGGDDDGGGKGVGYLRALGTVGRRVVDMGFVEWEDSIVEESNGEVERGGDREEEAHESVKTELEVLEVLHKSKYLLDLITSCKNLTRRCKQYRNLSKDGGRDDEVKGEWKEILVRYRAVRDMAGDGKVFYHDK